VKAVVSRRKTSLGAPGVRLVHEARVSGPTWRFSRSWRAGVGCNSHCTITFPRFSLSLPASRPGASQISLPLCGAGASFMNPSDEGGVKVLLRQQSHSFVLADDTPGIDVPREPRLRARLARDTASTTYIRRIGSMFGRGKASPVSGLEEKRMAGDATPKETRRVRCIPHFTCG
jgi:hypothetical protein